MPGSRATSSTNRRPDFGSASPAWRGGSVKRPTRACRPASSPASPRSVATGHFRSDPSPSRRVAAPTITGIVARLENDGLVSRRTPDPPMVAERSSPSPGRAVTASPERRPNRRRTCGSGHASPVGRRQLPCPAHGDGRDGATGRAPGPLRHPRIRIVTRLRLATGQTFASLHVRNFRLFFAGQRLPGRQLADAGRPDAARAAAHRQRRRPRRARRRPVRSGARARRRGPASSPTARDKRKLLIIVQTIAMVQSFALAALAFSGNPPVVAIYAVAARRRRHHRVRQPRPARRSSSRWCPRTTCNNAVSLNSALMTVVADRRPRARRPAGRHRRVRLGFLRRRPLLHRGAHRPVR